MKAARNMVSRQRMLNQGICSGPDNRPCKVVAALGAVQAQDYSSALWAIGLRSPGATEQSVEQAVVERKIVRTWPMRGTLHFVAADDVRWMLRLLTPRVIAGTARRTHELELDADTFARCRKLFVRILKGGKILTRDAILEQIEKAGISIQGGRGYHILFRLAQEGVICFGPRSGKTGTFVLLDEWIPQSRILERDAALAELALRYFTGHGPATLQDFVWWSGLTVTDARAGIESISAKLARIPVSGTDYWGPDCMGPDPASSPTVHLLPSFDEYLLGYKDRTAMLDAVHSGKVNPGNNGVFMHTVLVQGRVCATWKKVLRKKSVAITVHPFTSLRKTDTKSLHATAQDHARFLGIEAADLCV